MKNRVKVSGMLGSRQLRGIAVLFVLILFTGCRQEPMLEGHLPQITEKRTIELTAQYPKDTAKKEISLINSYQRSIDNEPEFEERDILAAINRWHFELYPGNNLRANPYILSSLADPITFQIAGEIKKQLDGKQNTKEKVKTLQAWMNENLEHAQAGAFAGLPGSDPWGLMENLDSMPAYKHETPPEMKALSIYTRKHTGKCTALAVFSANLMLLLGVEPDDIIILQVYRDSVSHYICFAKFEGEILYFDNTLVACLNKESGISAVQNCFGFLNHFTTIKKEFEIKGKFFSEDETLLQSVLKAAKVSVDLLDKRLEIVSIFKNRNELVSTLLNNKEKSDIHAMTKYAYQSLYVKRPELYLKASLRTSRPRELSRELKSPDEVFDWINSNIKSGSIFYDSDERIMTADEVITCKSGGPKDKAVLAFTLLKHKGYKPIVYVTKDNAYVEFDNKLFEAKQWGEVRSIQETVVLKLQN